MFWSKVPVRHIHWFMFNFFALLLVFCSFGLPFAQSLCEFPATPLKHDNGSIMYCNPDPHKFDGESYYMRYMSDCPNRSSCEYLWAGLYVCCGGPDKKHLSRRPTMIPLIRSLKRDEEPIHQKSGEGFTTAFKSNVFSGVVRSTSSPLASVAQSLVETVHNVPSSATEVVGRAVVTPIFPTTSANLQFQRQTVQNFPVTLSILVDPFSDGHKKHVDQRTNLNAPTTIHATATTNQIPLSTLQPPTPTTTIHEPTFIPTGSAPSAVPSGYTATLQHWPAFDNLTLNPHFITHPFVPAEDGTEASLLQRLPSVAVTNSSNQDGAVRTLPVSNVGTRTPSIDKSPEIVIIQATDHKQNNQAAPDEFKIITIQCLIKRKVKQEAQFASDTFNDNLATENDANVRKFDVETLNDFFEIPLCPKGVSERDDIGHNLVNDNVK